VAQTRQNVRTDGQSTFLGGANSGVRPFLVGEGQYSWGVNTTMRGGSIGPRPGYHKKTLNFESTTTESRFETGGFFQGAGVHEAGKDSVLLAMVGGRLFSIEPCRNFKVAEVTPGNGSDVNMSTRPRAYFQQAEDWTVVQNGLDAPIIYGTGSVRRAAPLTNDEVPSGEAMAYGNGRLWVSKDRGYVAGDLVGSSSGTVPTRRDAVLQFTENTFIAEGGAFALPVNAGAVTGMHFISNLDTVLGDGELVVFSRDGGFVTQVPTDRTLWKDLSYPVQRFAVPAGAVSENAIVNVNGDLYYRSPDGIRSLVFARRQFGSAGNTPISQEVNRALAWESPLLDSYASAVLFENRLLMTSAPQRSTRGVHHRALISMDFAPLAFSGQTSRPAYDGMWTGLNVLQIVVGSFGDEQRCFVFAENASNEVEIWEVQKDVHCDNDGSDKRIEWFFETRAMAFGSQFEQKKLSTFDLWLEDLRGEADLSVYSRPDASPNWNLWHSWEHRSKAKNCSDQEDGCFSLKTYQSSYRPRVQISTPPQSCNDLGDIKAPTDLGYTFQVRVKGTGDFRVSNFRLFADIVTEEPYKKCPTTSATESVDSNCPLSDFVAMT